MPPSLEAYDIGSDAYGSPKVGDSTTTFKGKTMLTIRRAADRGHFHHGWLETFHTFSFGEYFDPAWNQFRALRVINEDRVAPGQGFGMHGHRDMEIITWVLDGALAHRDSLGHEAVLRPGEGQRMSAGRGIRHSEFNPSPDAFTHLYQIWLLPDSQGLTPEYEQKPFALTGRQNRWQTIASGDGRDESLKIHQDAIVSVAELERGQTLSYPFTAGRCGWLQLLRGAAFVGEHEVAAGDAIAFTTETLFTLTATSPTEAMVFDLA